jgi:hypothetical protein
MRRVQQVLAAAGNGCSSWYLGALERLRACMPRGSGRALQAAEFWETGQTPIPVSAISGTGTGGWVGGRAGWLP